MSAIVSENISLADKFMEQQGKQTPSGIPKYPKKGCRRTYDDLLSGPESESEGINCLLVIQLRCQLYNMHIKNITLNEVSLNIL